MNLLAYVQQLEDEARNGARVWRATEPAEDRVAIDRAGTVAVAAKLREAVSLVNELAKLVIRYQGLLDRREMPTADAAELRSALGDHAERLAIAAAVFATIDIVPKPEEAPSELAARMRREHAAVAPRTCGKHSCVNHEECLWATWTCGCDECAVALPRPHRVTEPAGLRDKLRRVLVDMRDRNGYILAANPQLPQAVEAIATAIEASR